MRTHRGIETPTVDYIRIDLYAFGGGAGTVLFDNIRVTLRPETNKTSGTLETDNSKEAE